MIGTTELLIIFAVVVLLFGAKKLPELGGAVGESIKNFKKGIKNENNSKNNVLANQGKASHAQELKD